jgi:hypothetical protein
MRNDKESSIKEMTLKLVGKIFSFSEKLEEKFTITKQVLKSGISMGATTGIIFYFIFQIFKFPVF